MISCGTSLRIVSRTATLLRLGLLPQGKDYRAIDDRIIAKYGIAKNRWERCRRKRAGEDNLRYLRDGRWFLLIATGPRGQKSLLQERGQHSRRAGVPIRFHGYELTYRGGRVWVRIDREHLRGIRKRFVRMAVWAGALTLSSEFQGIPFKPYRPACFCQLFRLLREVNRRRNAAGLERPKLADPGLRGAKLPPLGTGGGKSKRWMPGGGRVRKRLHGD